jgi:hypothetical protein
MFYYTADEESNAVYCAPGHDFQLLILPSWNIISKDLQGFIFMLKEELAFGPKSVFSFSNSLGRH